MSRWYFAAIWGSTLRAWSAAAKSISRSRGSPALVMLDSTLLTPDWLTFGTRPE